MGKFTSGPDWMDIEIMMRAIDGIHSGHTHLVISAAGAGASGGLQLEWHTTFDALPGGRQFKEVVSKSEYPCKNCANLTAHLFGGIYHHDANIGRAYEQAQLEI